MRKVHLLVCVALYGGSVLLAAGPDRVYKLPCEIGSFAPSADGTMVWASCFDIDDAYPAGDLQTTGWQRPSALYGVDLASGVLTAIRHAVGWIQVTAAPLGARAIVVVPEEHSNGKAFLYDGLREVSPLSIDAFYRVWSADARRIYFYGGSTLQADAWNILGALRLDTFVISRTKLAVPTEEINICATNGHVFAGAISFDRQGDAEPYAAAEYDADLHFIRRNTRIPPGSLSASCRYVASPGSFPHGPTAWRIVDATTGQSLMRFEFTGEGGRDEFEFKAWNPKRDNLLLRVHYHSSTEGSAVSDFQVFDIPHQRVVDNIANVSGDSLWSRDGNSLIFARGQSLVLHRVEGAAQ